MVQEKTLTVAKTISRENQMDNQEVTATTLAWLAGFWDADGSIALFTHTEKNGRKKICPSLVATNTDQNTIAHIAEVLDSMGTSFHLFERTSKNTKHKTSYQLSTRNGAYIKVVLEAMLPYLVTKRAQAVLLLRYLNKNGRADGTGKSTKYTQDDWDTQEQVSLLNRRGPLDDASTTKRKAARADDIV